MRPSPIPPTNNGRPSSVQTSVKPNIRDLREYKGVIIQHKSGREELKFYTVDADGVYHWIEGRPYGENWKIKFYKQ